MRLVALGACLLESFVEIKAQTDSQRVLTTARRFDDFNGNSWSRFVGTIKNDLVVAAAEKTRNN